MIILCSSGAVCNDLISNVALSEICPATVQSTKTPESCKSAENNHNTFFGGSEVRKVLAFFFGWISLSFTKTSTEKKIRDGWAPKIQTKKKQPKTYGNGQIWANFVSFLSFWRVSGPTSSGASGRCLHGGACFKVEKAHFAA